ncbi:MAG: NTP transferase domain-containing protein [Hyphomicrobiales bacterium]|nr:NTP transferase domain-containing protein [Hyphomicrobiales bacterium]
MSSHTHITDAVLLAAGFGTRMGEIGKTIPKPLLPLGEKPLLEHTLEKLEGFGVKRIAINIHHRADDIESYIETRKSRAEILLSDEREHLLDTGGGILQAMGLLKGSVALVHNCDAFRLGNSPDECEDFTRLAGAWNPETMDALLLLQAGDATADFSMDESGALHPPTGSKSFRYVGVQIISTAFFDNAPGHITGNAFPIQPLWNNAIERGRLYGLEANTSAGRWLHTGTSAELENAQRLLLDSKK